MDRTEAVFLVAEKAIQETARVRNSLAEFSSLQATVADFASELARRDAQWRDERREAEETIASLRASLDKCNEELKSLRTDVLSLVERPPPRDGIDGADADPDIIRGIVVEVVAELPKPQDGRDADPELMRSMITEVMATLPAPKDGAPGRDGADADPMLIRSMVEEAVAAIPPPRDGKDGEQGPPGRDGSDVDALEAIAKVHDRVDAIREWTSGEIEHAFGRAIAAATDTVKSALDSALAGVPRSMLVDGDGALVMVRRDGSTEVIGHVVGRDGVTPAGVEDVSIDEDGNLVCHLTDGRSITRSRVRGNDGRNGVDGRDGEPGLGFDDLDIDYDGHRTITLRWSRGDQVMTKSFTVPVLLYTGVWKDGMQAEAGDVTTYAGSMWVAQRATTSKPGDGDNSGWRLAVKAGRNGASSMDIARKVGAFKGTSEKEFIESLRGKPGPQGQPGIPGRDRS